MPGWDVRILAEDGRPVASGGREEICLRARSNPRYPLGYRNGPEPPSRPSAGARGRLSSSGRAATVPGVNRRIAIPLVAAGTFVAGFGVAELTGVRAIGGLVLLAGGAWCARAVLPIAGPRGTVALLAIAVALLIASHPLGEAIGAWPAVGVSAALVACAAAALLGRRAAIDPCR